MLSHIFTLIFLAITAVNADCVNHVGNSWGCDAPAGTGVANYCIASDSSRPVRISANLSRIAIQSEIEAV